ncbi:DUF5924 family protein [Pseudomonas typographi]|uniref:DUF2914 domain-containing protein n=1 Tax=Pseudomonas typographi TaxID=2715964 RepID=A0ABR7Z4U9_9PSED|nr:DUF5924 family protein [Pseudomonas typographi]MBD1552975.1 DUF2914 domain-containing protein [Pseudomonas typographi]MBD1588350.1 DUF2914 domain-containing protein [Pseudomonas typographi]MBD1600321.1 DUF2914 domain-containing protein [Pseudomonas typographi]
MKPLPPIVFRIIALIKRYPGVVALFGFCSGLGSFILVDRQAHLATPVAIVLLVSWAWLMVENTVTQLFSRYFKRDIPASVLRYLTQMIHQESLFFVLPFFFITTSWNSGQWVFTGILGLAGLVSIIDPLYYHWLAPRRWLFLALHTLTLFAAMLTALPIILHLTTSQSFKLALGTAMLLSFPSLASSFPIHTWRRGLLLVAATLAAGGAGWLLRTWVPPATLWMTEDAITQDLDNQTRTHGEGITTLTVAQARSGVYAYTAINAPRGLDERIYHVWEMNGKDMDRIALDIHGGRQEGYRAWTRKQNFPAAPSGTWRVRVETEDGQLIGVLKFTITPDASAASAAAANGDQAGAEPKNQ